MFARTIARKFMTSATRRSGHYEAEGFPGANLPISIKNRYTLTGICILYFGSGFALPFLIVRHQMLK